MASSYSKFSLSDASDFLNSDDESEISSMGKKVRTTCEVLHSFVQLSGQNSSSDADDFEMDEIRQNDSGMSCKKKAMSIHSTPIEECSIGDNVPKNPSSQVKKRAGHQMQKVLQPPTHDNILCHDIPRIHQLQKMWIIPSLQNKLVCI